jgi:hypothetical protein
MPKKFKMNKIRNTTSYKIISGGNANFMCMALLIGLYRLIGFNFEIRYWPYM